MIKELFIAQEIRKKKHHIRANCSKRNSKESKIVLMSKNVNFLPRV
jgi:hypothetical protein